MTRGGDKAKETEATHTEIDSERKREIKNTREMKGGENEPSSE